VVTALRQFCGVAEALRLLDLPAFFLGALAASRVGHRGMSIITGFDLL
jgi:hypothetical protein